MPTVAQFFASKSGRQVAARFANNSTKLYYCELDTLGPVRPSVYLQDHLDRHRIQPKGRVLVNYDTNGWINQNSPLEEPCDRVSPTVTYTEAIKVPLRLSAWEQFHLTGLGTKPGLSSIYGATTLSEAKARRIYMLATFSLLNKYGLVYRTKNLGHNIGSLLVSKEGEVLSWGVNTGQYRHAEVNTIINYFRLNSDKTHLPADSVLFSTLKPCLMCSTLIKQAWNGGRTRVWYGMMDEGGSGATPLLGPMATPLTSEELELDVWDLLSPEGSLDTAIRTTGAKPVQVMTKGGKKSLFDELNGTSKSGGRGMSAADWVDYSDDVLDLIEAAANKLDGKMAKVGRDDGPVKRTLEYLKDFVK